MIRTEDDIYCSLLDIINFKCYRTLNKETSTEVMCKKGRHELHIWTSKT